MAVRVRSSKTEVTKHVAVSLSLTNSLTSYLQMADNVLTLT